ncbi:MAG: transposase [Methylococcales bacterium]
MTFNPDIHHRQSIRLQKYDYSQVGLYFITICTDNRQSLFGKIINGEMVLNDAGIIARNEWQKTAEMRPNVVSDEFVIMPNHLHGIINMTGIQEPAQQEQQGRVQCAPTVGDIVRGYKSSVTKQIRQLHENFNLLVWQRNYHEHIIRNEESYLKIAEYIQTNPLRWQEDKYYD